MSKLEIDFGTTPRDIIDNFIADQDPSSIIISKGSLDDMAQAIEEYASFQVGVEMAGEDI